MKWPAHKSKRVSGKSKITLPLICRSGFTPRFLISFLCEPTQSRGKPAPTLTDWIRPRPTRFRSRAGFSLIEVIATLVLSAILVALLLPLIGSSLEGNRRALLRMPATYSLRTGMDAVWQSYRAADPTNLTVLSAAITTAAALDPPPYIVIDNGWVDFNEVSPNVFNEFIPALGTENVLKVTLGNSQGERLTAYFFPIP